MREVFIIFGMCLFVTVVAAKTKNPDLDPNEGIEETNILGDDVDSTSFDDWDEDVSEKPKPRQHGLKGNTIGSRDFFKPLPKEDENSDS